MVQGTFILLLLGCSNFLVHSTTGSSSSLLRRNKMREEQVHAKNQTINFRQGNNSDNPTQRKMQDNNNNNVFTFPYNPNALSCQAGRKAKKLQRKYNKHIAQWESANKTTCYTYTLDRVCYKCPQQSVQVSVNDSVVTKTEPPQNNNETVVPTMDELFAMLRSCIYDCQEQYIYQCRVRFGGSHIIALSIDEYQDLIDDEDEIYVRNFKEC